LRWLFCSYRCRRTTGHEHRNVALDEIADQFRQPIVLTVGPARFDQNVFTLYKTTLFKSSAVCGRKEHLSLPRTAVNEPHHGYRWLLRISRKWPRGR
jgi:hypothetical protein